MLPDQTNSSLSPQEIRPSAQEETPVSTTTGMDEDALLPAVEGQPILPTQEASLPPEAQGETNGGPLGCCLGTVVGLFLTALLILGLSILLSNGGTLSFATIPVLVAGTIVGGYLGWRIGKRIYKEYEPAVVKRQVRAIAVKKKKRKVNKHLS